MSQEFTITNKLGLHARPAAMFVKLTNRFSSEIWVEREDEQVNGKSIMGILLLAAPQGTEVAVATDGTDEEQAMTAITALIEDGFGED